MGGQILEAGCGEGNVIGHIKEYISGLGSGADFGFTAFDISEQLIDYNMAKYPDVTFFSHNIYETIDASYLTASGCFNLIICSEVLEHLEEPGAAVKNLMKYGDRFIFSVPNEPTWRILNTVRGKYLKELGNTPGHIQHFSIKSFEKMLKSCGLRIVETKRPLPWLMVYCQKE